MNSLQAKVGPDVARKLVNLLGAEKAERVVDEVLPTLGLDFLASPDDRLRFGDALTRRGGVLEVLGRSIATQAILHGVVRRLDQLHDEAAKAAKAP